MSGADSHSTVVAKNDTSSPHAGKSYWLRDFGEYVPNCDLRGNLKCDVLVIGGGITGISTAWHAAMDGLGKVVLLESEVIGFGASGRAAGWIMPQFGMDQLAIRSKFGIEKFKDALAYSQEAVSYTGKIISGHAIECDYRRPGLMRVAFDDRWIDDLRTLYDTYQEVGIGSVEWKVGEALQKCYNGNANFKAAIVDSNLGLLDPCKQVRGLKQLAEAQGVRVFENSPAIHVERIPGGVVVATPSGRVSAQKLVLATNAFTHLLRGSIGKQVRRFQTPIFARAAVTERLTRNQWSDIGWEAGNAIESSLDLFHYMAPTEDGRILFYFIYFGGHSVRGEMEPTHCQRGAETSLAHLKCIFPSLRDITIDQHWGGHMSGTRDLVPHVTTLGDERVVYVAGCWGHGLALNHLHGKTVSHLLQNRSSHLTDFWFVNRKPGRWPVYPFDFIGKQVAWAGLRRRTRRQIRGSIFDNAIAS